MPRFFTHRSFGTLSALAIIAGFVAASCYFFFRIGIDDDLITLWSGETLGRDWWFINYNGERSEMTSSILAALVAKLSYWLAPQATYLVNRLLLFLCAPAALWLLWRDRNTYLPDTHPAMALAALLTAASLPYLQCWAQSALETPLHALILTWYAFALIRYAQDPSRSLARPLIIAQILLILVRPEGFWVIAVTFMLLAGVHKRDYLSREQAPAYIAPAIAFALLLAARYAATGFIFPNSAYAKVAFSSGSLIEGWRQVWSFYTAYPSQRLILLSIIGAALCTANALFAKPFPRRLIPLTAVLLVTLAYVAFFVAVGGSWGIPGWTFRLLAPVSLLHCCLPFQLGALYSKPTRYLPLIALMAAAAFSVNNVYKTNHNTSSTHNPFLNRSALLQAPSLEALNWELMKSQRAHGKDFKAVYLFIQNDIPQLLERLGGLRILTYQSGFFPYYIKKSYPDAPITFFDDRGLMDPKVGKMATQKGATGIKGVDFALQLEGEHEIAPLVMQFNPNLLYMVNMPDDVAQPLKQMGWKLIYSQPYAFVWVKR